MCVLFNTADAVEIQETVLPLQLEDKVNRLTKIAAKYPFIPLNTRSLKAFVLSHPKDYSFVILFTSLKEADDECETCKYYYNEYKLVGNSFKRCPAFQTNQMFLGSIDFKNNEDIFQMLSVTSTPVIIHFPPLTVPSAEDVMDFKKYGCDAIDISKWIQERTDIEIICRKPKTGFLPKVYQWVEDGLFYGYKNIVCNKDIWACSMALFSFDMAAGEAWLAEHSPPHFSIENKKLQFVRKNDMHYQYVYETYLVALLYLLVAVGMLLTIESLRGKKTSRSLKTVFGVIVLFVFFIILQAVFRMKESLYPFYFIFV
ncbi:magnesium transporter protein 1-like isoform X2 [Pectinophora gossypiella]|uniref:magnesium transporter protein 1-like isoform X2 n=1 Tax=Pectinophora gossypiella TaxID=13191 RepID=UPI00214E4502|nr:magnesium transporter protein 1-like isoform X2 [Pectinophora gossypiella]XP_049865368.1 magnesium transporter protein 1-like isoform X2 [Pectinophora gossypiella]